MPECPVLYHYVMHDMGVCVFLFLQNLIQGIQQNITDHVAA